MTDGDVMGLIGESTQILWGKANPTRMSVVGWHPLACHMIDSAEAAGWVWDEFLSPSSQAAIDFAARGVPGGGRVLLQLLASLHDLGKGTPAFQVKDEARCAAARAAGFDVPDLAAGTHLSHARLSGLLLRKLLCAMGCDRKTASWLALTLAGHHGRFPSPTWWSYEPFHWEDGGSSGIWADARDDLIALVCGHVGLSGLGQVAGPVPALPLQVVIAGAVILSDWIASDEKIFPYAGGWQDSYPRAAASRTAAITKVPGREGKWRPDRAAAGWGAAELIRRRFERDSVRPIQEAAFEIAARGEAGLLLIEAAMGEGKTEAALAAAEIIAAAVQADGIFVVLPSKATADQMLKRVRRWLRTQSGVQVVTLAHSGARQNDEFRRIMQSDIGADEEDCGVAASEWLLGSKRALLSPVTVGTIDQLLLAGVSSRHVSLRHLGLAGKVVVIDEVHACDAYMSEILQRALSWLGAARIPVIMLSATLAAGQREQLLGAYACADVTAGAEAGYPKLSWVPAPAEVPRYPGAGVPVPVQERVTASSSKRTVAVSMVDEQDPGTVPELAGRLTAQGGCALVLRNTVGRAQETYRKLLETHDAANVTLVHARFTVADRKAHEDLIISMFDEEGKQRPSRGHVTVGTQVLEQSLDCDWDVLISDLAPVDLLLQRLGRVHRHRRPPGVRGQLREPRMYVAGRLRADGRPPEVPPGSSWVYTDHLLWRTEAAFAGTGVLNLPADVPGLVDQVYGSGPLGPPEWQPLMQEAAREAAAERKKMRDIAGEILLPWPGGSSLADIALNDAGEVSEEPDLKAQRLIRAQVRYGEPSLDVILLRRTGENTAVTVSAGEKHEIPLDRALRKNGGLADRVLEQVIRLPAYMTSTVLKAAKPVEAWSWYPRLKKLPVLYLPLDPGKPLRLGAFWCAYSPDVGLEIFYG